MQPVPFGRWFGVPVFLQPEAMLLIAFYALQGGRGGAGGLIDGAAFGIGILVSVLVHELGHAVTAQAFRLAPQMIVIHGFGGFTRYLRGGSPGQGILVTFAGPAAGLVLGFALRYLPDPNGVFSSLSGFTIFWSVVNLFPLYPLDGGRIVEHGLCFVTTPRNALRWAGRIALPFWALAAALAVYSGAFLFLFIVILSVRQAWAAATS